MVKAWVAQARGFYQNLNVILDDEKTMFEGEDVIKDWVDPR